MPNSLKLTAGSFLLALLLSSFAFADDSVTITTYYPAPYGVYKEMRLYPNDSQNDCDANNKGAIYYDNSETQMKVCDGSSWKTLGGTTPSGAVMFFNLASCPSGWSELVSAKGRYLVGLPSGGTLSGIAGTALSNLEDRPAGAHRHKGSNYSQMWTGSGQLVYPGSGMASTYTLAYGGMSILAYYQENGGVLTEVIGTNAPYIQLLVCQKS